MGEDGRFEFTIIGDVVNRVAKLDKHGRRLGVRGVMTAAAFEAAGAPQDPSLVTAHLTDASAPGRLAAVVLVTMEPLPASNRSAVLRPAGPTALG